MIEWLPSIAAFVTGFMVAKALYPAPFIPVAFVAVPCSIVVAFLVKLAIT